jgi:hypothetical protein
MPRRMINLERKMTKKLIIDSLLWGIALWLIGYILSFMLYLFVPASILGWIILPIGIVITFWVLLKMIKNTTFLYYLVLSFVWTIIAVVFDYLFIVILLKPADGYYKLDVYLYYVLTFIMPYLAFLWKRTRINKVR